MSQTIDGVYRDFKTAGVPTSGEHEPGKPEIRALLKQIQNSGGMSVTRNTATALLGVTPPTENYMGVVLDDRDATKNGYYSRVAGEWVRERGFPETAARLVGVAGSGNAPTASTAPGVDPGQAVMLFFTPRYRNTGAMTLSVNGAAAKPLLTFDGQPMEEDFLSADATVPVYDNGTEYRLLWDHRWQTLAAQTRTDRNAAIEARGGAELAQVASEAAQELSEEARDAAEGYAEDAFENATGLLFADEDDAKGGSNATKAMNPMRTVNTIASKVPGLTQDLLDCAFDGVTDDTARMQSALLSLGAAAEQSGAKLVFPSNKRIRLSRDIFLPAHVSMEFNGTKPVFTGSISDYRDGFTFRTNVTDAGNIAIRSGSMFPEITNLNWDNENDIPGLKAFYSQSKHALRFSSFNRAAQVFKKVEIGSLGWSYIDQLVFERVNVSRPVGSEYMFDIDYYGDALLMVQAHIFLGDEAHQNANMFSISKCNGGKVSGHINGNCRVRSCRAISLENLHLEFGGILAEASGVSIRDAYIYRLLAAYQPAAPIQMLSANIGGVTNRPSASSIENVQIVYQDPSVSKLPLIAGQADMPDLIVDNWAEVSIKNFTRAYIPTVRGRDSAAKVGHTGAGAGVWSEWDKDAARYSKESRISSGSVVSPLTPITIPNDYFVSVGGDPNAKWQKPSGTYYYRFMGLIGPKDRLVGKTFGTERSFAATLNGNALITSFDRGAGSRAFAQYSTVRAFRGSVSGSYDEIVDIPGMDPIDLGFFIGTGEYWQPRSAGPVDTINTQFTSVDIKGPNIVVTGTSLPTVGAWTAGDEVILPKGRARYDGTNWLALGQTNDIVERGDAGAGVTLASEKVQRVSVPITTNRTFTLPTTGIPVGWEYELVRDASATGAFFLRFSQAGTPVKDLSTAGIWCRIRWNGTNWIVVGGGNL